MNNGKPFIYAFWHEHIISATSTHKPDNIWAMISSSDDGEIATRIVKHMGFNAVRGSSHRRGAAAAKDALRKLKEGKLLAIAIDGPKGPRRGPKAGVAQLAYLGKVAILPLKIIPLNFWQFNSWDKFKFPKPFSIIKIEYCEPIFVNKSEEMELLTKKLTETLNLDKLV